MQGGAENADGMQDIEEREGPLGGRTVRIPFRNPIEVGQAGRRAAPKSGRLNNIDRLPRVKEQARTRSGHRATLKTRPNTGPSRPVVIDRKNLLWRYGMSQQGRDRGSYNTKTGGT